MKKKPALPKMKPITLYALIDAKGKLITYDDDVEIYVHRVPKRLMSPQELTCRKVKIVEVKP